MAQPTMRQQASVLEHRCRHRRRDDALIASRAELWAVTAAALDVGCGLRSVECVLKPLCGRVYVKHARRSQITHTTETATQQTHTLRRGTYNTTPETQTLNRQISYEKSKNSIVRTFVRRCSAMCESSSYKNNSSREVLRRASTSHAGTHTEQGRVGRFESHSAPAAAAGAAGRPGWVGGMLSLVPAHTSSPIE